MMKGEEQERGAPAVMSGMVSSGLSWSQSCRSRRITAGCGGWMDDGLHPHSGDRIICTLYCRADPCCHRRRAGYTVNSTHTTSRRCRAGDDYGYGGSRSTFQEVAEVSALFAIFQAPGARFKKWSLQEYVSRRGTAADMPNNPGPHVNTGDYLST